MIVDNLATGGFSYATVWDVKHRRTHLKLAGRPGNYVKAVWGPKGDTLAITWGDHSLQVWNAVSRKRLAVLAGLNLPIHNLTWSPDGKVLAGFCEHTVLIWDWPSGSLHTKLLRGQTGIRNAWSPDGKRLATASYDSEFWRGVVPDRYLSPRANVMIWDVKTAKRLAELYDCGTTAEGLSWSPDGRTLAGGAYPGLLVLWDTQTWKMRKEYHGPFQVIHQVAWSPDSASVAATYFGGTMVIWSDRSR